eukprot:INCI5924.6.p1 GENE.INCI5924.6~~INCI5924.6.p1  ORF type:complete len:669 (-),score=70.25 INCI5924.6:311-2017(-)
MAQRDYIDAFQAASAASPAATSPFLVYYYKDKDAPHGLAAAPMSRAEFWRRAKIAAGILQAQGVAAGSYVAHYFSANDPTDLVFRVAATLVGAVPVTVNWQADTYERVLFKVTTTKATLVIADASTPREAVDGIQRDSSAKVVQVSADMFGESVSVPSSLPESCAVAKMHDPRIVIFTSGTTGNPKGVKLTYNNYRTNRRTFEQFLAVRPKDALHLVVANPLHHTNSTAITDWAIRRHGTTLHLFRAYTTRYWHVLHALGAASYGDDGTVHAKTPNAKYRVVAPLVSRHIDFLDALATDGKLNIELDSLRHGLAAVNCLLGSAPVGPTTCARLRKYTSKLPVVRFGSTETCLQVMGTPISLSEASRYRVFEAGWANSFCGVAQKGYYIGRFHPGCTQVKVVQGVDPTNPDTYMVECAQGEPGLFVVRGGNIMLEYVNQPKATANALHRIEAFKGDQQSLETWYVNLGDVGFWRGNPEDGQRDFFWQTRDSNMLIKGGSNYSYEQINAELSAYIEGVLQAHPATTDGAMTLERFVCCHCAPFEVQPHCDLPCRFDSCRRSLRCQAPQRA